LASASSTTSWNSAFARAAMVEDMMIHDMAEGIATFLDKRRPTSSV
jgi:hypothetical protein